jgi:hypothetical protein
MDIIKDLAIINSNVFKKSIKGFKNNWVIIFTGFAYTILNLVLFSLVNFLFKGVLSILAGFVAAIITSSLISNYLYLLYNIIKYDRISLENFKDGFKYFIWKVYGIFFIAWVVGFLLDIIGNAIRLPYHTFNLIVSILVLIIFNPLPEIIYQKSYSPWESVISSFEFMKENWFNWLLPNALFTFLIYKFSGRIITNMFVTHLSFNFDLSARGILIYLLGQVLFSFIMFYRGFLFEILSTSTRRKRFYMRKFYD